MSRPIPVGHACNQIRDGAVVSLKIKHVDLARGEVDLDAREVKTKFAKSFKVCFFPVGGQALLIVGEWIAFLSEKSLMTHEEQLERQQKLRAFASQNTTDAMRQHLARSGEMQDDMAIRHARDERRAAQSGRKRWFLAATVLIVLGFVFQFLGALPL